MAEILNHRRVMVAAAAQGIGRAAAEAFADAGAQVVAADVNKTTLVGLAGPDIAIRLTATYTPGQIHVIDGGWSA